MMIALLIHAFLLTSLSGGETLSPQLLNSPQTVMAASADVELVEGFDEITAWSYSHTLPKAEDSDGYGPQRINSDSLGVLTTAESVLVLDRRTKKVLFEKSSTDVRPIASITKIMTALTLLELEIDFSKVLTVYQADSRIGGRVYVYPGEQFTIQDLWMDGLIASDNVAIVALVRSTGFSEPAFVDKMNDLAGRLGLENSHFVEPTGINGHNVSTAADVAKLIDLAMQRKEIVDAVRRPIYSFAPLNKDTVRTIKSTNRLLNSYINEDPYQIVGGKTGFTFEAGYSLAVVVDGPGHNDDLIIVVLGADSTDGRFQEVKGLVDWTYENYRW